MSKSLYKIQAAMTTGVNESMKQGPNMISSQQPNMLGINTNSHHMHIQSIASSSNLCNNHANVPSTTQQQQHYFHHAQASETPDEAIKAATMVLLTSGSSQNNNNNPPIVSTTSRNEKVELVGPPPISRTGSGRIIRDSYNSQLSSQSIKEAGVSRLECGK